MEQIQEKKLMNSFQKKFGKFFKKNYQMEEETKEGVNEMKEKILSLEEKFSWMMGCVERISNNLEEINKKL